MSYSRSEEVRDVLLRFLGLHHAGGIHIPGEGRSEDLLRELSREAGVTILVEPVDGMVASTIDKTALLLGEFERPEVAASTMPFGDLYTSELAGIGGWDVDDSTVARDEVLRSIEKGATADVIADTTGMSIEDVDGLVRMVSRARAKRSFPAIPKVAGRSVGTDWRE